jgi:hypothetical protein
MAIDNAYGYYRDIQLDENGKLYINNGGPINEVTSQGNSTIISLASGTTFTGTSEYNTFQDVMVVVKTDQPGTLYLDFSIDGINWDSTITFNYHVGEINPPHIFVKGPRYFRTRFTNTSSSPQSFFRLGVFYGTFQKLTTAIDGRLPQNFDALAVRPTKFEYEVALGNREGTATWNQWGYNDDIDIGTETVWSVGGIFSPLTTDNTLSIVSTSTNDTSGGTGARSIIVYGIDANRDEQTEVVTLNGTTPVVTTSTWLGINRLAIYVSGSGATNAGTINVTAVTAGTVQGQIPIGLGASQSAIFFVSADHQMLLDWMLLNINKTGGSSPIVTIKMFVHSFVSNSRYEVFRHTVDTAVENTVELKPSQPFQVGENSVITLEATTNVNNTTVSLRFSGVQIKNR